MLASMSLAAVGGLVENVDVDGKEEWLRMPGVWRQMMILHSGERGIRTAGASGPKGKDCASSAARHASKASEGKSW